LPQQEPFAPPPASNAVVINTKAAFTIHTPSGITDASKPLSGRPDLFVMSRPASTLIPETFAWFVRLPGPPRKHLKIWGSC
jgi:hypothetical protein